VAAGIVRANLVAAREVVKRRRSSMYRLGATRRVRTVVVDRFSRRAWRLRVAGVRRHALVIGAGLAGPTAALFLRKVGITATLYEARPQGQPLGGGLVLGPNGMNVLAELGLADRVKARGTLALENRFYTEAGRRLARYSNGGTRYGQPAIALARDDLRAVVHAELASRAITVRYRKQLVDVERPRADKIVARFEDGTTAEGDLLVGADGVRSRTRAAVFPEAPSPAFAGAVGVSGVAPGAAVPRLTAKDKQSLSLTFGARGLFCYCGTRGGDVMWWSSLGRARPLEPRELEGPGSAWTRDELLGSFGRYHAPIAALIEASGPPVTLNLYDVATLPRWHDGRAVLVGDAAHAVSPSSGQAAALALEDAMDLAKRLRDDVDHTRAFEAFERERRARVERITAEGTPLRMQLGHFARWAALNLRGRRTQDWVYRYRVDWSPVAAG
jgi:2-polyprenyl-6-methoxyphenol hydroxylase-like FAD-dependent oxidoreductase